MAKQVWKLGKFDKGINSHTDPKDIKDGEWVELDDVNISKVGLAKCIGQPRIDTSVHQATADNLISGNGFYRFTSDNSYVPASTSTSYHALENTIDGGGGTFSEAIFNIQSLVWVFPEASNIVSGYLKFQLFIGTTAITDQFIVMHADGTPNFYTSTDGSANNNVAEINIYGGTTESFQGSDFDDLDFDDNVPSGAPKNSAMIGKILNNGEDGSDTTTDTDYYSNSWSDWASYSLGFSWAGWKDWFTNGYQVWTNGSGFSEFPRSDAFWDRTWAGGQYHEVEESVYNDPNLPFSAIFDSSSNNEPNGVLSIDSHDMMGFYKWDGYRGQYDGYQTANDMDFDNVHSAFVVPVYGYESGMSPWPSDGELGLYGEYFKMRYAFQSQLIYEINNYSGGSASDRCYAMYVENTYDAGNNLSDYDAEDIAPPEASGDGTDDWHTSEYLDDMIRLFPRAPGAVSGDIKCKMTYYDTSGASISGNGGETGSTGITAAVHLLDDKDTYGFIDGQTAPYEENDLINFNVTSSGPFGGAMVLNGNTGFEVGDPDTNVETWRFTLKGNSNSQNFLNLYLEGTGDSLTDKEILNFQMDYDTNVLALDALKLLVDALTGYTSGSVTADSDSSGHVNPGYYLDIKASTGSPTHQFNLRIEWVDGAGDFLSTIGVDDEQFAFLSKSNTNITLGAGHVITPLIFKVFSTFSSTWITNFSNLIATIGDNDYTKYLNWYTTGTNISNPLFYDEGNVLRIVEANFSLKQELEFIYDLNSLNDNISNDFTGHMWANTNQWIGYKDISNHFGNSYTYLVKDKGFFIGNQAKIWNHTQSTNQDGNSIGLVVASTDNLTSDSHAITGNDALMKLHFHQGSSGGIDWTGSIKIYAVACYDDGSETLPGHYFSSASPSATGYFDDEENVKTLKFRVLFKPSNNVGKKCFEDSRIDGIRLYYTHSEEDNSTFWNLGKFDFNRGFIKASVVDTTDSTDGLESKYQWETAATANIDAGSTDVAGINDNITIWDGSTYDVEYIQMPKTESYEDINGFSPMNNTLYVDFKAACIAGRRAFVGNIRVWNGNSYEYYNDRMIVSPVNSLDTFPYPGNILDLDISDGDEIIALTSYGDKVLQFKKRICYILNISTGIAAEFFIEERHKWKGIQNKNHFCMTDDGIFWLNDRGAWIYNGEELRDLFIRDENDSSQQIIDRDEWASFISDSSLVGYDAYTREVIIVKKNKYTVEGDSDCYIYSLIVNAWTKGIKRFYPGKNNSITNFQNSGSLGKLCYLSEESNSGAGPGPIY